MDIFTRYKFLRFYSALFATLNIGIPLIVIPLVAYKFDNWWLLFGILLALIGSFISIMKGGYTFVSLATLFCIGFWIKGGFNIHQYVTFYYFSFLFGFIFYGTMAEFNKRKAIVGEQVYEIVKHELTEGETGKKLKKEIDEEMEKMFGKKNSN